MSANRKPELYRLLKESGAPLTRHYRDYSMPTILDELKAAGIPIPEPEPAPVPQPREPMPEAELPDVIFPEEPEPTEPVPAKYPMSNTADPNELPGQRVNQQMPDGVIRVDDQGRLWFQEEVRKPAYPRPRGRRVLKYVETGVSKETVQNGEYIETFEVAGVGAGRPAEVKVTLPSYEVGIYKDPRFPFRIHCYNEREGFSLFEVEEFYGGAELVPDMCKRIYIENDLCYDIRSVVRAIQAEHRQLQLAGKL